MALLGPYIKKIYNTNSTPSSLNSKVPIFSGNPSSAPLLSKDHINRILIYAGSFNPPHRAHMHLLTHVFNHGCHDLNVIAAVITPSSDTSLRTKVTRKKRNTFMFGSNERCALWRQDPHFPKWAWVLPAQEDGRAGLFRALKEKCGSDGYKIEYVVLSGPDCGWPHNPPDGDYGCEMVIMSDAGRRAEYRGRSDDRLKSFEECTKWRGLKVDEKKMQEWVLEQEKKLLKGEFKPESVQSLQARSREKLADLKCVIQCRRTINDQILKIRFVKWKDLNDIAGRQMRAICSSKVREIMKAYPQKLQKLESKVLSPSLVSDNWFSWVGPAKRGLGECVTFPPSSLTRSEQDSIYSNLKAPAEMLSSLEYHYSASSRWESNAPSTNDSMVARFGDTPIADSLSETKEMLKRWRDDSGEGDENRQCRRKRVKRSKSVDFDVGVNTESWLPIPVKEMGFCFEMP